MADAVPDAASLVALFDGLFATSTNTRLLGGGDEPIYRPADAQCPHHRLIFREDFAASALHEIAHWCVAGNARRLQVDFGYWYAPDGRTREQQRAFERVEVKPQALEWIFSHCCGLRFRPSVDNLGGEWTDPTPFAQSILRQVGCWLDAGLPRDAQRFADALTARWGSATRPVHADFSLDMILPDSGR